MHINLSLTYYELPICHSGSIGDYISVFYFYLCMPLLVYFTWISMRSVAFLQNGFLKFSKCGICQMYFFWVCLLKIDSYRWCFRLFGNVYVSVWFNQHLDVLPLFQKSNKKLTFSNRHESLKQSDIFQVLFFSHASFFDKFVHDS